MSNSIGKLLATIWDAQTKPKEACKTIEDNIARIEERRSGRINRAVIAGVLSAPLILWPFTDILASHFGTVSKKRVILKIPLIKICNLFHRYINQPQQTQI